MTFSHWEFFPLMTICWDILTKWLNEWATKPGQKWAWVGHCPDVGWVSMQHPPAMVSPLTAPLCLLLAGSLDRERYSARGERRLNMVWWGMWENSRVHWYICQPACQPSTRPSRPLRGWTRGAFVPPSAGYTLPCPAPAPAPHLTLLSILLCLLCLALFTYRHLPQNSTAGPLWK